MKCEGIPSRVGRSAFDLVEGVWIVEPKCLIPMTVAIRQSVIALYAVRQAHEGQQTKTEMVYQYINVMAQGKRENRQIVQVCHSLWHFFIGLAEYLHP